MTASALLAHLAAREIRLRAEGGTLFAAPADALTPEDKAHIARLKPELMQALSSPDPIAAALDREAAEGHDTFPGLAGAAAGMADTGRDRPRRGGVVAQRSLDLDVPGGGGHAGWLREGRGRWNAVARGATWDAAWDELLRVGSLAPRCERVVLPEGRAP